MWTHGLKWVGVACWLSAAACQAPAPAGLTQADRDAIQSVSDAFVRHLMAKNFDSVSQLYTEDAIVMPPNAPTIRGRGAIREFMAAFPAVAAFSLSNEAIDGRGDLAYVRGSGVMTLALPGNPVDTVKYVEIRRRDADGVWRLVVDMFSSNLPPPPPPQPAAPARRR